MKILDRIILTIYTFCLVLVSILMIIFPFDLLEIVSINTIETYLKEIKGNYWYSIIGLAFLLVSVKFLISGLIRTQKNKYIVRHTSLGELRISSKTVEGLTQSVVTRIEGIKDIDTIVNLSGEKIIIIIRGVVNTDINIPEVSINLQNKVKEHIEKCTGVEVSEVMVEINNISAPIKVSK